MLSCVLRLEHAIADKGQHRAFEAGEGIPCTAGRDDRDAAEAIQLAEQREAAVEVMRKRRELEALDALGFDVEVDLARFTNMSSIRRRSRRDPCR